MTKALVVLASDKDVEYAIRSLLSKRGPSIGARNLTPEIEFDIFVHPGHDPGCLDKPETILEPLKNQYDKALVVFDRHGCGDERPPTDLIAHCESRLSESGWANRSAAIVLDPEIEVWVWATSVHVENILGWKNRVVSLREWHRANGRWPAGAMKPPDPKATLLATLKTTGKHSSASLFARLGETVGLSQCTDPAFLRYRHAISSWFPA